MCAQASAEPPRIVVMGVSGCGKSTLALALAQALGARFIEGDELHPPRNVVLMASGTPLTDDDRQEWLQAIGQTLAASGPAGAVVSCSALKRSYRDLLRQLAPRTRFVHLHGPQWLLEQRLAGRAGHYMPAALLQSQLDTLQCPQADEAVPVLDMALATAQQVSLALQALQMQAQVAITP